MNINFISDLTEELERTLLDYGSKVPSAEKLRKQDKRSEELKNSIVNYDLENLLLHVFTIYSRRVPVKQWNVLISDKLSGSEKITAIVQKLSEGLDVNSLLSNRISNTNQAKVPDQLLSEWGIHHLHFKEERSEDLLFVYFHESDAYIIDILKHETRDGSIVTWTNTDLVQTIHDNWPQVIEPYIFRKNVLNEELTTEERRTLRKKACTTSVIVDDGTEYLPMGGGYSVSKYPTIAVRNSDALHKTVQELQRVVTENYSGIKEALAQYTTAPQLKLKLTESLEPIVVEINHGIKLEF